MYDPDAPFYGNTNMEKFADEDDKNNKTLAWDKYKHSKIDTRLFYAQYREPDAYTKCRWDPNDESLPRFYRQSYVSDWSEICYSTEALKFAQAGYLVSIVCV